MPEIFRLTKDTQSKYEGVEPTTPEEKALVKKYFKLAEKITDNVETKLKGCTVNSPEYWGLREVLTEEEVDVLLTMKLRKWYTMDQIIEQCKKMYPDPLKVKEYVHRAVMHGIVEYDYGDHYNDDGPIKGANPTREKRYRLSFFVPGSAELFNSTKKATDANPPVANFFERMTFLPLEAITPMVPEGGDGIGMHTIPVEKAIESNQEAVKLEKISYWLKKYDGHIASGICSCRYSRAKLGEGCEDDPENWCIQLGDMADYAVETGRATMITKEEALRIMKKAEDNGFVHQITNIDGEDHIFDICNCDVKICNALRTSMLFNTPNLSRSAYTAKVDPKNCVACGRCVESCPGGAVKLGQKLCKKDGSTQTYPIAPLPDNNRWGKYAWDENYRDTARYNTYPTGTAPCKTACPAHVAVEGYLKLANQGRYDEALALIKRENPFPAVCGRICNKRCETACTRGDIDQAVAIDAVKKFLAERELDPKTRSIPEKVIAKVYGDFEEKIAIIGAGPAGLSAAYYLAVKGYHPTVFERHEKPGGMMMYGIPSYKLEKNVIDAEVEVLRDLGVEIKCGVDVGKDITLDELRAQGYKAFYIAIGCQGGKRPGVANDTADGTEIAVSFLKGAYDNQDQKIDGDCVVIGGGNVAIDCARTAHRFGAKSVSMYCLESRDTMPATKDEIKEAEEEGIKVNPQWGPKEVLVDENGKVKGIILKKCTRTIDPETKRFSPVYDENDTIEVPATKIIFAIGQAIDWGDLLKGSKVTFWHGNYPIADKFTYQTAQDDIFVGGDVYTGPKFVIDAIGQGHEAAESLARFVSPFNASLTIGRDRRYFIPLDKKDILYPDNYDNAGRQEPAAPEAGEEVKTSFRDFSKTLTEEQIKIETSRCLQCGASVVDPHKCIGCGICTTRCEFDAIHLVRDHPKATTMRNGDDKIPGLIPYALKRGVKIMLHSGSKEARELAKKRKAFKKATKNSPNKHTGNAIPPIER